MVYCRWYSLKSTVKTVILYRWPLLSYLSILASTDTQHNPSHSSVFLTFFFTFLIALTFCNFLQKNDPRFMKLLFCRFWAKENFSTQLKILKSYVALGSHFKGLFSTIYCQFSCHQSNKNSTQFYSQFRNFFPCNVLYKIFQIFNQKNSW